MFLGTIRLALNLHRRYTFDCIDAHYVYPDSFAAVLLGWVLDVPVVITAHGSDICLYPTSRILRPMIRWTLRRAAKVISVSEAMQGTMINELGVSPTHIEVIPNGVDTETFRPQSKMEARRLLGIPASAKVGISVAALVPSKGHELLIHAVPAVLEAFPDFKLYLVGEGRSQSHLRQLVDLLRLHNHVSFVGEVRNRDLKYWYNAADVTCLASHREGFPCVLLESLACGTPVVATAVGGIPEIISSEVGALSLPNAEALAGAMKRTLCANWISAPLLQAASTFTWNKVMEKVDRVLSAATCSNSMVTRCHPELLKSE